jgi:glycosyltransferase involved in cell wall biosynthesis
MKIGYITKEDPNDIKAYSGTHYSMLEALRTQFDEVIPLGPLDHWYKYMAKFKGKIKTFKKDKVFKFQYDLKLAKKHARIIEQRIDEFKPDVLIGSLVSPEMAFLETDIPIYLTTDATFPLLQDLYKSHSNLYSESIKNALILERAAFKKAKRLLLPLEWLSRSALQHYRIPIEKISVIPYGSNLDSPDKDSVEEFIENRLKQTELNVLFVGVRWEEKGGPQAVEIVNKLNDLGIKSKLKIVGCYPDLINENVEVVGFLDKQDRMESQKLKELYSEASFFILPTKAECIGMSFIEAASYGLPAIGTEVGGVPEAVTDNETGIIINSKVSVDETVNRIAVLWNKKSEYSAMSVAALKKYSTQMNWENWGKQVKKVIETDLSS